MADVVSIILKLEQVRQFVSGADQASHAITGVGTSAEKTGKKVGFSVKGLAKWAGGAAALYGAQRFIRDSVSATEDLGRSTLALQRTTGMDVQTASAWASVAKSRGLATKQLQVGFVKLSKEIEKSRLGTAKEATTMRELNAEYKDVQDKGGKKAPAALATLQKAMGRAHEAGQKVRSTLAGLGVSQQAIARGNTQEVLNQVADGFMRIRRPTERAALAQQLFGRGGQALLPILMKGRKGIADQLAVVEKYGAVLGVKTVGQLKELLAGQRELGIAQQGLKIQLGTALMPILLQFLQVILAITRALAPLIKNGWLFKGLVIALAVAFIYYKSVMLVATIAQTLFNASMTLTLALVAAIPLLIIALIVVFVLLYKKVGWFRAAVDATWKAVKIAFAAMVAAGKVVFSWIKRNWPLLLGILLGPFALAAVLIIRHFGAIKKFVLSVVDAIRKAIQQVVDLVTGIPGKVTGVLKRLPGAGLVGGAAKLLPFQHGGTMPYPGPALVGERGPEVVNLPRGARVTPLTGPQPLTMAGATPGGAEVVVPLYLDGKEVARSVARVTADKLARR